MRYALLAIVLMFAPGAAAAPWWLGGSPKITTTALPDATATKPYSVTLTASGGKAPYQWSSTAALPVGLTLSTAGTIAGTPSFPGTPSVYLKVTDTRGRTGTKTLSLTILPAPSAPPLVIQTLTIPNGSVGLPYSFQIQVTGGTPPYHCDPDPANNLAEFGLSLSATCLLSGTPIKAGAVHF